MTESTTIPKIPSFTGEGASQPPEEKQLEKWMAFPVTDSEKGVNQNEIEELKETGNSNLSIVNRAAEWGLSVKKSTDSNSLSVFAPQLAIDGNQSADKVFGTARRSKESKKSIDSNLPRISQELQEALSSLQQTFVVSDAKRPDCPIMYASAGFYSMTGYPVKEVIGRNCRFLQGPDTDEKEIEKIREALREGKSYCGRILNYKKNGAPFWNLLTITPIRDSAGNVIKFIGMQVEVSKYTEGLNDKTLRPNALPVSLIRYDDRQKDRAMSSITEVVQTVKHPQSHSNATELDMTSKVEEHEQIYMNSPLQSIIDIRNLKSPRMTPLHATRNESLGTSTRKSSRFSLMGFRRKQSSAEKPELKIEPEILMTREVQHTESWDPSEREKDIRQAIDLATTLERIEKNFVITDPRLPDNPIIFASDSFLELTEYSREEILGRNCR